MGGTFIIWIWVTGTFIGPSILTNIREHDKNYNKWEGHSLSQNVTGVLDRIAPDVVMEVLRWVFKLRTTLSINKPQRMGTRLPVLRRCSSVLKSVSFFSHNCACFARIEPPPKDWLVAYPSVVVCLLIVSCGVWKLTAELPPQRLVHFGRGHL